MSPTPDDAAPELASTADQPAVPTELDQTKRHGDPLLEAAAGGEPTEPGSRHGYDPDAAGEPPSA